MVWHAHVHSHRAQELPPRIQLLPFTRCEQTALWSFTQLEPVDVPYVANESVRERVEGVCDARHTNRRDVKSEFSQREGSRLQRVPTPRQRRHHLGAAYEGGGYEPENPKAWYLGSGWRPRVLLLAGEDERDAGAGGGEHPTAPSPTRRILSSESSLW